MIHKLADHARQSKGTWPHPADARPDPADLAAERMREALRLLDSIDESLAAAYLQQALSILERESRSAG